jgi:hypothetical protein
VNVGQEWRERLLQKDTRGRFFRGAFSAIGFNRIEGDYLEFGCHSGNTFRQAFIESRRAGVACHMWAFDSFQGLPIGRDELDQHPRWAVGSLRTTVENFRRICAFNEIGPGDYTIVEGLYEDTLSKGDGTAGLPESFCLAYVDCDLYSSTSTVLSFLARRIRHGSILAFDDYNSWTATGLSGDRAAFLEFEAALSDAFTLRPYLPIGWHGMSFVVESVGSKASEMRSEPV